jgi:hypothetical protein
MPVKKDIEHRKEVAEVLGGFMQATKVGTFNFTNLLICIYEADQAAEVGYEAVEIFEQAWKDKQWQEAIGGAIATVAFVQGVEQTIPACEAVDSKNMNWSNFEAIKNSKLEIKDLQKAGDAIEKHEYTRFGFELGSALMNASVEENLFIY